MSNPRPLVDFYVYSAHEVANWEAIIIALLDRGADVSFIVEPPGRNIVWGSPDGPRSQSGSARVVPLVDPSAFERIVTFIERTGLPWRTTPRFGADAAVTTQGVGGITRYPGLRVRTGYGVGLVDDSYGHGEVNAGFDLVLAHGEWSARQIRSRFPHGEVQAIGFPKWAPYLRGEVTRESARRDLEIDERRPVIAYLPTWAHHSSIDRYATPLRDLPEPWEILVKPHHNNLRFEPDRLESLDGASIRLIDDQHSLVPFIAAADVVMADARSGSFTEAILAARPVVGIVPVGEGREHLHPAADEFAVLCDDPDDLAASLTTALESTSPQPDSRVSMLFHDSGGRDDALAADTILHRAAHHRPTRSRRASALGTRAVRRTIGRLDLAHNRPLSKR